MEKNFKTGEIIAIYRTINEIMNSGTKLPSKFLWNMRLNQKELHNVVLAYDEFVKEIQQEYMSEDKIIETVDDNGNPVKAVAPQYRDEFIRKIFEIEQQDTTVNVRTVPYELIADIDFTGKEWLAIEFMLDDPIE